MFVCVCVEGGGDDHLGAMIGDGSDVRRPALPDHQSTFISLEDFTACAAQEHQRRAAI